MVLTDQPGVIDLTGGDDERRDIIRPAPISPRPRLGLLNLRPPPVMEAPAEREGYSPNPSVDYEWNFLYDLVQADEAVSPGPRPPRLGGGRTVNIDGQNVFIPNSPELGTEHPSHSKERPLSRNLDQAPPSQSEGLTAEMCLERVLAIFPDVQHNYVLQLFNGLDIDGLTGQLKYEAVVDMILTAGLYPKQDKADKKRKRGDSPDPDEAGTKRWERPDREFAPRFVQSAMRSMLKAEFPEMPFSFIIAQLNTHGHFYHTYIELAKAKDTNSPSNPLYGRGRAPRGPLADADTIATNSKWPALLDELYAARKRVQALRAARTAEETKRKEEQQNLENAIAAGETAECQACFDDLPMNRQVHCNGDVPHFTCFDCIQTYIKTEIGESRCGVVCTAGCGAGFARDQLDQLSDKSILEKLEQLQQEKDIRDAGLEDLEECPFCDYKVILPPIEEDFEFRCANPSCEKTSCRRCKAISHVPISCEQHAKEHTLNSRHRLEEAMTAAMIRSCNKCNKQFIKDHGCNKMRCPSCGNLQCYVCSKSIGDYAHFEQDRPGPVRSSQAGKKCPLFDNVEARHAREVEAAEAAVRTQLLAEDPALIEEDLAIKVSDAVRQEAEDRIQRVRDRMPRPWVPPPLQEPPPNPFGGDAAHDEHLHQLQNLHNFFGNLQQHEQMQNDGAARARFTPPMPAWHPHENLVGAGGGDAPDFPPIALPLPMPGRLGWRPPQQPGQGYDFAHLEEWARNHEGPHPAFGQAPAIPPGENNDLPWDGPMNDLPIAWPPIDGGLAPPPLPNMYPIPAPLGLAADEPPPPAGARVGLAPALPEDPWPFDHHRPYPFDALPPPTVAPLPLAPIPPGAGPSLEGARNRLGQLQQDLHQQHQRLRQQQQQHLRDQVRHAQQHPQRFQERPYPPANLPLPHLLPPRPPRPSM